MENVRRVYYSFWMNLLISSIQLWDIHEIGCFLIPTRNDANTILNPYHGNFWVKRDYCTYLNATLILEKLLVWPVLTVSTQICPKWNSNCGTCRGVDKEEMMMTHSAILVRLHREDVDIKGRSQTSCMMRLHLRAEINYSIKVCSTVEYW